MKRITVILVLMVAMGCAKDVPFQPPYSPSYVYVTIEGRLTPDDRGTNLYALVMPVAFEYVDHFDVWSKVDDTIRHPEYTRLKNNRATITFYRTMYVGDGCWYEITLKCRNTDQGRME